MKERISRCTTSTKTKQGIWWSLVGIPNNTNVHNLFAVCDDTKKTHLGNSHNYGDKRGNANIWIEILQCTRKTQAMLKRNRHKIAQGSVNMIKNSSTLQCMYFTFGLFDFSLFSFGKLSLFHTMLQYVLLQYLNFFS